MRNALLMLVVIGLAAFALITNLGQGENTATAPPATTESLAPTQQATANPSEVKPEVGFAAPVFTLKGLDGKTYMYEGKRNKPIVINFWASWCGPCRIEAPDLEEIYKQYKDRVDFYAVNLTNSDKVDQVKEFVNEFQLTFPVLLDEQGTTGATYQVMAIPTTFFVGKDGIVTYKLTGVANKEAFEAELQRLLEEK